ncbi:MAG TPA: acyltransferase, partial [Burkholderiaceae bacterium]
MAPATKPRQIAGLNGVRALAVIGVVWHHGYRGPLPWPILHNGFLGVDVFFVLSGFLITTLLLDEQMATGRISLVNFYARRALRIFPLYYAVLALLAAYFLFAPGSTNAPAFIAELPYHASYTSNWVVLASLMGITWSLSTEEQFYLAWPPLLARLGHGALWTLSAFLLLNQLVNFGFLDRWLAAHGLVYASLPILQVTFTPIVLGVALAYAVHAPLCRRALAQCTAGVRLLGWIAVLLAVANVSGDVRGWPRLAFHLTTTLV